MEEKKLFYQIILECWEIAKQYCFRGKLSDEEWDKFIKISNKTALKYVEYGNAESKLAGSILLAIIFYQEIKEKERSHGTQTMGALADRTPAE